MSDNSRPNCGHNSFDFTSKLEFEAASNLLRSRSDTSIRYGKSHTGSGGKVAHDSDVDHWNVPAIEFSLNHRQTKASKLKFKNETRNSKKAQTSDKRLMKKPLPKVLERARDEGTPFVTTFRLHSAGTAKRLFVKHGMYHPGPYRPLGPHAFRGDDFRPDPVDRFKGKPPFITSFTADPGNLELQRKSISVHNEYSVPNRSAHIKNDGAKMSCVKPFITFAERKPKWERRLVLPKETYQRGLSKDDIRMNQIMETLPWCSREDTVPSLYRPDINDYKTVDWLRVTRHSKEEKTILR